MVRLKQLLNSCPDNPGVASPENGTLENAELELKQQSWQCNKACGVELELLWGWNKGSGAGVKALELG